MKSMNSFSWISFSAVPPSCIHTAIFFHIATATEFSLVSFHSVMFLNCVFYHITLLWNKSRFSWKPTVLGIKLKYLTWVWTSGGFGSNLPLESFMSSHCPTPSLGLAILMTQVILGEILLFQKCSSFQSLVY
jgi:hypothetical protein